MKMNSINTHGIKERLGLGLLTKYRCRAFESKNSHRLQIVFQKLSFLQWGFFDLLMFPPPVKIVMFGDDPIGAACDIVGDTNIVNGPHVSYEGGAVGQMFGGGERAGEVGGIGASVEFGSEQGSVEDEVEGRCPWDSLGRNGFDGVQ